MIVTDLKSRTHKILEAVIQAYTETGTPVGSEYLCQRYRFGVSPATIRNVMARLEELELVSHPHTSAGRVPTDMGYRYYVDLLMQPTRLKPEEEEALRGLEKFQDEETEELLRAAARILSELTGQASVVLVPQMTEGSFRHLELIPMDPQEVVGVLIASEGLIKHMVVDLEEPVLEEELDQIERFLNQELSGMPLAQVYSYLEDSVLKASSSFFHLYKRAKELLSLESFFEAEPSVILEGTGRVFEAPEFKEIGRARRLIRGLESQQELAGILRKDLSAHEVRLHIGNENRGTSLTDCAIAAAPYRLRGVAGAVGILGPTRLDYPRMTALVGRTAQLVTRFLEG